MIGKIIGVADAAFDDSALINVRDVCYVVFFDKKTLHKLSSYNGKISIFIETVQRENETVLFGFLTFFEQCWFRELVKLNGISGKIALSIMGTLDVNTLGFAIATKDEKLISTVPGIGKKLANRIVNEMVSSEEKVKEAAMFYRPIASHKKGASVTEYQEISDNNTIEDSSSQASDDNYQLMQDAISAVCSLGFNRASVYSIIQRNIANDPKLSLEDLVKITIKDIGSK